MSFTVPLPPRTQLYNRSCSNKHTLHCPPAHRETAAHFHATGVLSQQNRSDAKASALRINLNIQGCSVVAPPFARSLSRSPSSPPPPFTQYPSPPRSLVRAGQTSPHRPRLVVPRSRCPPLSPPPPPPPREQLCNRYYSNKNNNCSLLPVRARDLVYTKI
jgi:hypothetical protein